MYLVSSHSRSVSVCTERLPLAPPQSTQILLSQLPCNYKTSTALALAVRAHSEAGAAAAAAAAATAAAAHEPGWLGAADVASTALWLLGDGPALAALAHRCIGIDKYVYSAVFRADYCNGMSLDHLVCISSRLRNIFLFLS